MKLLDRCIVLDRFFVLLTLAEHAKLNRDKLLDGMEFSDLFSSYLRGLQED